MRLAELEPTFVKIINPNLFTTENVGIQDADGLQFLCPVCFKENNGPVGTHSIICWKPQVPLTQEPGPGRWNFLGTSLEDITLQAGSSSIFLTTAPCKAHFFIRNGGIE
jgi:hypothetical protein